MSGAIGDGGYRSIADRLDDVRRAGTELDRLLRIGELTHDAWKPARKPLLREQRDLEARLAVAEPPRVQPPQRPDRPARGTGGVVRAVGRFLAALVTGLAAGIPILAGIAVESAVIVGGVAWFLGPNWRWDGVEVFWWAFGIQAAFVALFAVPGAVVRAAQVARHGWDAA
jgi:hypothetical protein